MKEKDYMGLIFGRLTVVSLYEREVNKRTKWLCLCECGNEKVVTNANLKNGTTQSCGCLRRENTIKANTKDFAKVVYPNTKFYNSGISKQEYVSIHDWIKTHYGKANHCSFCGADDKRKFYDWALRKGFKYSRDVNNFIQLCRRCHIKYDFTDEKRRNISNGKKGKKPFHSYRGVIKCDESLNEIDEYESITAASKSNGISLTAIANNLSGRTNKSGGFVWKYKSKKQKNVKA